MTGFIRTHSLQTLYSKVMEKISVRFDPDMLILLDHFYIDSRYPGELGLLPNGTPSMSESLEFYQCAKIIFEAAKLSCQ